MAEPQDPYPFPSRVQVASSVTLKLNDRNYLMWKTQFESLLSSQKLLGFVNGQQLQPPATVNVQNGEAVEKSVNPRYDEWFCTDQLVRSWLLGTLSEEVLGYVFSLSSSQEIWNSLAENFNKSSASRVFELRRSLQSLSKSGKNLLDYSREFRAICDQLSAIGQPMDESMKIFTFLNGLDKEYDPIVTVVEDSLTRSPSPTFNDAVSMVVNFDKRLQSREPTNTITHHLAFQSEQVNFSVSNNNNNNNSNNRGRGSYGRFSNSRGNRGGYRGGYSSRGRGFHQQVSHSPMSSSNNYQPPVCQICGRTGHTALKCWNRFDNAYQSDDIPQALAAMQISESSGREWYPDSGASAHVTDSSTMLTESKPYHGSETVMVGNGSFLPITHVGSTNLTSSSGVHPGLGKPESANKGTSA